MAKWKVLQLNMTAESKMHFGNSNLGMVELTHRYIPGKAMWGAVTAILSRRQMPQYDPGRYREVGKCLQNAMRFTNSYIIKGEHVYIPGYTDNGLEYHRIRLNAADGHLPPGSDYLFEKEYIRSYTSTALTYTTYTSDDNSLHEIEYLKPGTTFVGYILYRPESLVERGITESELKNAVRDHLGLQGLGGNRSRGFGKLSVQVKDLHEADRFPVFFQHYEGYQPVELDLTQEEIGVELTPGRHLAMLPLNIGALTKPARESIRDFRGNLVPVVSRLWGATGAGQEVSPATIIMQSGSTFSLHEPLKLNLTYDGFLE